MDSTALEATTTHPADAVVVAHDKLLHDGTLQFDFSATITPAAEPNWLLRFTEFLAQLRPVFEILFWAGIVCVAGLILYAVGREAMRQRRRPSTSAESARGLGTGWRPPVARICALLADADALAAEGKFSEAVHVLLLRSIDDIDERRPRSLKPALTGRDIARMPDLPPAARAAFGQIAEVVERSFFGGRPLDASDFAQCRRIYEDFALPGIWSSEYVSPASQLKPA